MADAPANNPRKIRTQTSLKKPAATQREPQAATPNVARVAPASKKKKVSAARRVKEQWAGPENVGRRASEALVGLMHTAAKEFNEPDMCVAGEAGRLVVGVALPSFCFEYVLQNNVWPLERIVQLVGVEKSCKSGFAAEVGRWFIETTGGVVGLKEHESKYSPDWVMSIIGHRNKDAFGHMPCDSINHWQRYQQWMIAQQKRVMMGTKTEPGPGPVYAYLDIVDSILGKSLEESQGRIETAGSAGRDHPVEAQSITKWMRFIPQRIRKWPFSIILINHLKPQKNPLTQTIERHKGGGRGKDFQESMELELTKVGRLQTREYDGLKIKIKCAVSGLGVENRSLMVKVRWWDEPLDPTDPESPWVQKTVWDWHGATIELLLGMKNAENTRRREIIDLTKVTGDNVYSKALGIPKDKPLSFSEAGRKLHQNQELLDRLRRAFGIKMRSVFTAGTDYRKLRALAVSKAAKSV